MNAVFQATVTPFTASPEPYVDGAHYAVLPERLALVALRYWNFDAMPQEGALVCLDVVVEDVIAIFKQLFEDKFPLTSLQAMDHYAYDDNTSMNENNSSCFNPRLIAGSHLVSLHAYGLAIDVNPLRNPFITLQKDGTEKVSPEAGRPYLENYGAHKGQLTEKEVFLFKSHGFTIWGGDWQNPVDLHHFQPPRFLAQLLAAFSYEQGKQVWDFHKKKAPLLAALEPYTKDIIDLYRAQGDRFFDKLWSYVTKAHTVQECDRYVHQLILHKL